MKPAKPEQETSQQSASAILCTQNYRNHSRHKFTVSACYISCFI